MPRPLGAQNPRVAFARELLAKRGRESHGAYAIEGATLLDEALRSGVAVRELFVTAAGFEAVPRAAGLEAEGIPVHLVADRVFEKISDVENPAGVLAVVDLRPASLETVFGRPGVVLLVADLNDPGNLGTLLRAAEAFDAAGAIVGDAGVDAHHPKVVRAAMGAHFRLPIAVAGPAEVGPIATRAASIAIGLAAGGDPLHDIVWPERCLIVVGHERHGLGRWEPLCDLRAGIPMAPKAESLNAAVAGSIALYEATRGRLL